MSERLQQYVQYIKNTGGVNKAQFDDDWEPIGPMVRGDMEKAGLISYDNDQIVLTEAA